MRSRWRYSLGQLLAAVTGLAFVLAAALGHFGTVVQLLAVAMLLAVALALLRWVMEIGIEAAVYGLAYGALRLYRMLGVPVVRLAAWLRGQSRVAPALDQSEATGDDVSRFVAPAQDGQPR